MDTQDAYNQYLVSANNQADYMNTILWIMFAIFVITPLFMFLIYCIYYFAFLHKNNIAFLRRKEHNSKYKLKKGLK